MTRPQRWQKWASSTGSAAEAGVWLEPDGAGAKPNACGEAFKQLEVMVGDYSRSRQRSTSGWGIAPGTGLVHRTGCGVGWEMAVLIGEFVALGEFREIEHLSCECHDRNGRLRFRLR